MKWPMVYVALFIEYPTPFIREYFDKIMKMTYPRQRLGILIHNQVRKIDRIISITAMLIGKKS